MISRSISNYHSTGAWYKLPLFTRFSRINRKQVQVSVIKKEYNRKKIDWENLSGVLASMESTVMIIDLLGICLPSFCICTNSTKYCKHGIDLLLLCDIGVLQLIYFQVEGFHEVKICSFQAFSGHLLLVVGRFRSFFAHDRSFQVIYCLF